MANQRCLDNIRQQPPPDNRPCTDAWCAEIQGQIDEQCRARWQAPDTPVLSKDPNLFGPDRPGFCYCCCSCSSRCLDNIHRMPPPDNRPCSREFCAKSALVIDAVCRMKDQPMDTPVRLYDPNLYGPDQGGDCYCCCGRLPQAALAVESSTGTYPAERSSLELALEAGAAVARWSRTGFSRVEPEVFAKRFAACQACPHLAAAPDKLIYKIRLGPASDPRVCGACGCVASRKAHLPTESCPVAHPDDATLNRWGEPRPARQ